MTIGEYFRCPSCGQEFAIKLQMDETYKVFDWPIHVSCPSCERQEGQVGVSRWGEGTSRVANVGLT